MTAKEDQRKKEKRTAARLISWFQPGIEIFARADTQFQTERERRLSDGIRSIPSPIDAFCSYRVYGVGILLVNIVT